jgi:hypothetical protein
VKSKHGPKYYRAFNSTKIHVFLFPTAIFGWKTPL